jgi:hypothetical protein
MRHRIGEGRTIIQFGSFQTDSDGEGGIIIDELPASYSKTAVILSPQQNLSPAAFELLPDTYHVTVSVPQIVTINYVTVSSD